MKKLSFFLLAILLIVASALFTACDNKIEKDIKDIIATNLLKIGSADTTLLIGEWDGYKFAHTKNGITFTDVTTISCARLTIPFAVTPIENDFLDRWEFHCISTIGIVSTISGNLINLTRRGGTFFYVPYPHEERCLTRALAHAYSFVIVDDKLIIHFTGNKERNLLIFKRREL